MSANQSAYLGDQSQTVSSAMYNATQSSIATTLPRTMTGVSTVNPGGPSNPNSGPQHQQQLHQELLISAENASHAAIDLLSKLSLGIAPGRLLIHIPTTQFLHSNPAAGFWPFSINLLCSHSNLNGCQANPQGLDRRIKISNFTNAQSSYDYFGKYKMFQIDWRAMSKNYASLRWQNLDFAGF